MVGYDELQSTVLPIFAFLVARHVLIEFLPCGRYESRYPRDWTGAKSEMDWTTATIASVPSSAPSLASADCSSWMRDTEMPCASTVTQTAVVTSFTTTLANPYPGLRKAKREELEGRQAALTTTVAAAASCTPSQSRPSSMPAYIDTANIGRNEGDYYGGCQSSGSPGGNPVVYGFGYCPNQGGYMYMIPNNSNSRHDADARTSVGMKMVHVLRIASYRV
ncbi:hypothetical protein LX32DRAFT_651994 [Colletotrichum zoysiae]|uniref:Uncharacterized protein n=1 Tax=Colletotrichum zoysiae TaxID=1216348 RepID=A0AAD9M1Y4_9PEZI|nr:hypothetical protein LX32DRAFT_651994 [Colletotrichum zoysiae]